MNKQLSSLFLLSALTSSVAADSFSASAFIQPASPTNVFDTHHNLASLQSRQQQQLHLNPHIKSSFGTKANGINPQFGRNGVPLFAKKKKDTTTGKGGKVQVKLLKHVAGTGKAGDVIMVAPAFFTNKLQKTKSAIRISDGEVEKELAEKDCLEKEQKGNATSVKNKLEEMKVSLRKKAGPNGHLFGGVGYKTILSEIKKDFPQGCLDGKQVKITEIKMSDGKKLRGDIKEIGEYSVNISLMKGITASLELSVAAAEGS